MLSGVFFIISNPSSRITVLRCRNSKEKIVFFFFKYVGHDVYCITKLVLLCLL